MSLDPRLAKIPGVTPARRWVVVALSAAGTLAAVALIALIWALWTFNGDGPISLHGSSTTVIVRRGASLGEVASSLERAGVVRSAAVFAAAAQVTGAARELKPGEYEFGSRSPMSAVLLAIRNGDVVRHMLTIPEGYTSEMVAETLQKMPTLTGEAPQAPEGAILPDSYQYENGDDRAAVLKRMMDARDQTLAALWAERQPNLPFTIPEQAVILASIVEKETGVATERPKVAAVFVNRLRLGMRLESDPTIIYGISRGRPLGRGLRLTEVNTPSPYNTYLIPGLPPTPIANPGRAALAAVLDPPQSDALFFVADGSGGHAFAATYNEHLKNVAHWRDVQKARAREAAK